MKKLACVLAMLTVIFVVVPSSAEERRRPAPRPLPQPEIREVFQSGKSGDISEAMACVPAGWKIVGGGARVEFNGAGGLLTASYPEGNCWIARSKAHEISDQQRVEAMAVAIRDESNRWDVVIDTQTSGKESHPTVQARLRPGYVLTGGGARANWTGAGSLLTASFPATNEVWEARAKDHGVSDPSTVTAYVIGIRARNGSQPTNQIFTSQSGVKSHPSESVYLEDGWRLTGGGARVNWSGAGSLLFASTKGDNSWRAIAKDHKYPSPASISVFAIGMKF